MFEMYAFYLGVLRHSVNARFGDKNPLLDHHPSACASPAFQSFCIKNFPILDQGEGFIGGLGDQ